MDCAIIVRIVHLLSKDCAEWFIPRMYLYFEDQSAPVVSSYDGQPKTGKTLKKSAKNWENYGERKTMGQFVWLKLASRVMFTQ